MNISIIENTFGTSNERDLLQILQSEGLYRLAGYVEALHERLAVLELDKEDKEEEEVGNTEELRRELMIEKNKNENNISKLSSINRLSDKKILKNLEKNDFLILFEDIHSLSKP